MNNDLEPVPTPEPKRSSPWLRRIVNLTLLIVLSAAAFVFWIIAYVQVTAFLDVGRDWRPFSYAIVLGASVKQDGTPSDALYDRVVTAVELYKEGKVEKLLMTGDDGKFHVDEVEIMKRTAVELGVPEQAISTDGQGYRTYESCKRAKQVFGIEDAYVVTQRFHLGRAMYLCEKFGIEVKGQAADRQSYQRIVFFWARDLAASFKAWWDINAVEPHPPVEESERD